VDLFLFILTVTFASFFQGVTGFGSAVIATPIALTFLDKETAVVAFIFSGIFLNLFLTKTIKESLNKPMFITLLVFSSLGMPLGVWFLKALPITTMRIVVGLLSILFAFAIFKTNRLDLSKVRGIKQAAGFISGLLQTSTGMSGPPIALFLTGSNVSKNQFRKVLVSYFLAVNFISLVLFSFADLITIERLGFGLYSIPFIFVGAHLGNKTAQYIPQKKFRIIALLTVCLTGIFAVYSGLKS